MTYGVNLNFRKNYRKEVSIGGYYTADDEDVGMGSFRQCPHCTH